MVRRHVRLAVRAFIVGVLIAATATVAFAATATSSWGYYGPILGYSYQNQATVSNDGRLYGATSVQTQDQSSVPTGYMGVKAGLYKSDGLCEEGSWYYNSSSATAIGTPTFGPGCGAGIYYSKGLTQAYNGDGYDTYWTFQTPNINN